MARQKGVIKLEGRIGDLSFYKSGGDYLARSKGGVDGDRIKNDPAFARTRENGVEFGRAGKASKLLRNALKVPISKSADNRVASRLTTNLLKVIKADTTNKRGERTVLAGDLSLLQGFEFNRNNGLDDMVKVAHTVAFDRATGQATVVVDFANPNLELVKVEGGDVVRFTVGVAAVDFENNEYEVEVVESDTVALDSTDALEVNVTSSVSANSTFPVFVVLGAEYYQEVNGENYLINSQESRALALIAIDTP